MKKKYISNATNNKVFAISAIIVIVTLTILLSLERSNIRDILIVVFLAIELGGVTLYRKYFEVKK